MNKPDAADERARAQALDPLRSFIVQAPAGSGKTALLTQRYLRLLACVEAPEEIVAITFTRKAAGEMRERIVRALETADSDVPPEQAHLRRSWELARAARARDLEREWHLAAHPARLRIQTIDSLNAEFTRQMPVLSGFGAQPAIAQRPRSLYREAARRTLECLEQDELPQRAAIAALLGHLDNDLPRTTDLLAEMLPQRDQWLRLTGAGGSASRRERLVQAFEREISHQLQRLTDAFPRHLRDEVVALAEYAAGRLRTQGADSALDACIGLQAFPVARPDALPVWRGLAELLLTQGNTWRKRV
ncbi:MAG TPA: UvrD-helicase domain-containing protein, partial [Gammaproteobacteria bacterium]|nr:UvrD-helicase domain-containing protein [Gammaproteobacteria bacterium]